MIKTVCSLLSIQCCKIAITKHIISTGVHTFLSRIPNVGHSSANTATKYYSMKTLFHNISKSFLCYTVLSNQVTEDNLQKSLGRSMDAQYTLNEIAILLSMAQLQLSCEALVKLQMFYMWMMCNIQPELTNRDM